MVGGNAEATRRRGFDMRLGADELAGVVDLFGALSRSELATAVEELAFRRGVDFAAAEHEAAVEEAVAGYHLVSVTVDTVGSGPVLVPGPTAFPTLPDHGQDLPHIVDVATRSVDRDVVGQQVEERLRHEAAQAVATGDTDRMETLLDVSYDVEAWAPVAVPDIRSRLADSLDGT